MRWPWQRRALEYSDLPASLVAPPTDAGVAVNAITALQSPTTLGCLRLLSETVGALPVHLYQRGPDGARERDTAHPAAGVLARPNPWTGPTELRTRLMLDALLHGDGYARVIRVGGRPRELHRLDPAGVQVQIDPVTAEPVYQVAQKTGAPLRYGYKDIVHVQAPGSLPEASLKLLHAAREAVALDLAMARYQARVFSAGGRPSGILTVPKGTKPEQRGVVVEAWNEAHGAGNVGRTAVVDADMNWKPISLTMVESDFLQLRKHAASEINRVFKIPETLNGNLDRGVWRNIEELTQIFLDFTLTPWLDIWTSALSRVLLKDNELADYFLEFKIDAVARANLAARFTAYRQASGGSWMTPNEIRQLSNLAPLPDADDLILQAGQAPAADGAPPDERPNE